MKRLLGLHALGGVGGSLRLVLRALGLEVLDELLQRVLAAVEDEVVGQLALDVGDLRVGRDVVGIDHRQVEARLYAVMQEHRVEHRARPRRDAEGHVGNPQRGLDIGDLLLDRFDPRDRLDGRRPPLLIAGGEREREAVEDQQLGVEAVLLAAEVADALGDLDLALCGLGHADLVDRQRDQRRAMRERHRDHAVELGSSRLEVHRVDDRAAGDLLQGPFDHLWLCRVDLDRRGLGERDLLGHQAHLFVLVGALGQRHAQVEHVRAAGHLVLGDLHQPVVVLGQQQFLGLARALRVDALSDHRRRGLLRQRRRGDHRGEVRHARCRTWRDRPLRHALGDRADVLGRGSAAAADDPDAVALHELLQRLGQRLGLLGEDRLAVGPLQRQPGIGDTRHRDGAEFAEEADCVAHVLRAGRAVQADHVDLQRLQRGQHR